MQIFLYILLACFIIGFVWEILSDLVSSVFEGICYVIGVCIGIYILYSFSGWILKLCGVQDPDIISNCCRFVFGLLLYFVVRNNEDDHPKLVMLRWTILGYLVGVWFGIGVWTGLIGFLWGLCCYKDSQS